MKRRKILFLFPLAALILSGCSFEEVMDKAKSFLSDKVVAPISNFFDLNGDNKKEEPKKEEKEDKEGEGQGQEGEGEGEGGGQQQQEKTLQSISLSGQYKTEYELDEAFDSTGLIVTAAYDDGSSEDVSEQASFSGFDSSEKGDCLVTVSFEGQTAEFTVTIVKTDWRRSEKALMEEHLYGIVLPFLDVEGAEPKYDEQQDSIMIEGLTFTGNEMATYAGKFDAADGWEDVTSDYSATAGTFYSFERSTQTENGMRRIAVKMSCEDSSGNAASKGEFTLSANDPFSYEFPAAELAAEFQSLGLPAFSVPAPSGDLYFEFYANPYNADNLTYLDQYGWSGLRDYVTSNIYVYGFNSESFEAYADQLEAAGWTLTPGSGSNDYDYYASKLLDQGIAHVELAYVTNYSIIRVEHLLEPLPNTTWPADEIAALVNSIVPNTSSVVPPFESDDITNIDVDEYYEEIDVYGPQSLKEEYRGVLAQAGWTETDTDYFTSPQGDLQIRLIYSTTYGLRIILAPAPAWPTESAAALVQSLAPGSTTVVPPLPGGSKYSVYTSLKEIDVKGPESLKDTYKGILIQAGWTELGTGSYIFVSPAQDIQISLSWNSTYGLEITFAKYVAPNYTWPASDIDAAFASANQPAFSVPPFEGEGYMYETNGSYISSYGVFIIDIKGADPDVALPAYASAIELLGWDVTGSDNDYAASFVAATGVERIEFFETSSGFCRLYIYLVLDPLPAAEWPAAEIAAYLGAGITDPIPAYPGEASAYQFFEDYGTVIVSVEAGTEDAAIASYVSALNTAGFVEGMADSYGDMRYVSPNGQFIASAYLYGTGQIAIAFGENPFVSAFPIDKVNTFLTNYGLGFQLTADLFENFNVSVFESVTGTSGGYPYIRVNMPGDHEAELTAILDPILAAAGFEYYSSYGQYYNDNYSMVSVFYENGVTSAIFMY